MLGLLGRTIDSDSRRLKGLSADILEVACWGILLDVMNIGSFLTGVTASEGISAIEVSGCSNP